MWPMTSAPVREALPGDPAPLRQLAAGVVSGPLPVLGREPCDKMPPCD